MGASTDGVSESVGMRVMAPGAPPPSDEQWDKVLSNVTIDGDVVVPDGQRWLIGPNVQVAGTVRTANGTIAMRPGSSLKIIGADIAKYVGGGMHFMPQFANDRGIWVGASHGNSKGKLDIACTPKTSWNRTGVDPTWKADDEYYIAPTAMGDYTVRRWYPGQAIPQIDPRVPAAEVANVTRDCVIEGPGHIHVHSSVPQRIEFVRLEKMGIKIPGKADSGRYALHLHHCMDGTRGTSIRGVAAVNSGGRVFVPHISHGVTMIDNVSVKSLSQALWWDGSDRTQDLTVDRLLVLGVSADRDANGIKPVGIHLPGGERLSIRNSAVAGMTTLEHGRGFSWTVDGDEDGADVWEFVDNVAHNNRGHGLRLYNTKPFAHVITNFKSYRNGNSGIESGGYASANHYVDTLLLHNNLSHHANSRTRTLDGQPGRFERLKVYAQSGPAIRVTKLSIKANPALRWEFTNCVLQAGPGSPKVLINSSSVDHPWRVAFRRCGMVPDDIAWTSTTTGYNIEGSSILIEHEDGREWDVTVQGGKKVVKQLK